MENFPLITTVRHQKYFGDFMGPLKIEDLDVSLLSETEITFLKRSLQSKPFIWLLGIFCGAEVLFAMSAALFHADKVSTYLYIAAGVKGFIFIILSMWVRSWSLLAAIFLLVWHLYSNAQLLSSNYSFSKIRYIAFAIAFLVGLLVVKKRKSLLKRTPHIKTCLTT